MFLVFSEKISFSIPDFIGRFIQHIPDTNFKMIRYYGFLANRVRGELLPIVNDLLFLAHKVVTSTISFIDLMKVNFNYDFLKCPSCGGILELTRRYFGLFGTRCADEIHQKLATSGFEKN